jgi:CrcB protein
MMNTLYTYLLLAMGGAIGTMARYGVSVLALPVSRNLPWGTIVINILGSFIIGFFGTLTLTHDLIRGGSIMRALANIILSVVLCVCAVAVGHIIAAHLNGGASQIAQIDIEEDA